MPANASAPLRNITREALEPLWSRHDIPTAKIAAALGVSRQALSQKARVLGLPSRARNQAPNQKLSDAEFRKLWLAGVSTRDIAKAGGYSHPNAVCHRADVLGLPRRQREAGAGRRNGRGQYGWVGTISMSQFLEHQLGEQMAEMGAPSQAARHLAPTPPNHVRGKQDA
ncbi:MAG: hypothetical protein GYB50_18760 [Rhodobacteraceae bacterium]|nr:hypothetical protein [Paracoccaceae bacterium]